jgi:hypothetical protein
MAIFAEAAAIINYHYYYGMAGTWLARLARLTADDRHSGNQP